MTSLSIPGSWFKLLKFLFSDQQYKTSSKEKQQVLIELRRMKHWWMTKGNTSSELLQIDFLQIDMINRLIGD